jgi:hypothetical protein
MGPPSAEIRGNELAPPGVWLFRNNGIRSGYVDGGLCAQPWAVWLGQVSAEPLRHAVDWDDSDPVLVRDVGSDTGKVDGVANLASSMFFFYYPQGPVRGTPQHPRENFRNSHR